jgi:hypothetical protein
MPDPDLLQASAHTGRPAIAAMLQRFHDTGRAYLALVQLDFSAERIRLILARAATAQNRNPESKRHLHRFSAG